jgi:anti-sigma regulatory factor (Ser/Thr protein kinase)
MQLGFDELDELAYSATFNSVSLELPKKIIPLSIGPLIELDWLRNAGLPLPSLESLASSQRLRLVKAITSGQKRAKFETQAARAGMIRCYWQRDDEPDDWYFFCKSMQDAALMIGFPRKNAEELVAGARELVANIYDHSGAPQTGIAGYAAIDNEVEFIIADKGIGVLESLRSSPELQSLRDAGEALEAALTDGTSRHGQLSGHGGGFRDLFRGLSNLSSVLRFRSGDHALTINGVSPGLSMARISQKTQLPGFVISIACMR